MDKELESAALLIFIFLHYHNTHIHSRLFLKQMEHEIDGWIEQLSQCKQLPEADVKKLCDKVRISLQLYPTRIVDPLSPVILQITDLTFPPTP